MTVDMGIAESNALKSFQTAIYEIDTAAESASRLAEELGRVLQKAKDAYADAKDDESNAPDGSQEKAAASKLLTDCSAEYNRAEHECNCWGKAHRHDRVFAYCMAFEKFLMDFLANELAVNPPILYQALKKKWGLSLKLRADEMDHREEIESYLAADRNNSFSNPEDAGKTYKDFLGANPFAGDNSKAAADVELAHGPPQQPRPS